MSLLIISVLALLIGVAIYPIIRKHPSMLSFFDAFVLVSIVGLAMLHLIPHSVEHAGIWGLLAVVVGFGVPALVHSLQHGDHHGSHGDKPQGHSLLMICIFVGFLIHTVLDGMGLSLSSGDETTGNLLGLGVMFHRLPEGFFLSMMLVPRLGIGKTWILNILLAVSTVVGFLFAHYAIPEFGLRLLYVLQGLISGMLLHVLFHDVSVSGRHEAKWTKGVGALAGFGTLAIIEWIAPIHNHGSSALDIWVDTLIRISPFWGIFAVALSLFYLGRCRKRFEKPCRFLCDLLDPQPIPAIYGGVVHAVPATGILCLCALFSAAYSSVWALSVAVMLALSSIPMRKLTCCDSCRPMGLCSRDKSYALWLSSSMMQVACLTLVATILPQLVSPIAEWVRTLSPTVAGGLMSVTAIACLLVMARKRGLHYGVMALAMFVFIAVFHDIPTAPYVAFIAGMIGIFFYDFNPHDIGVSIDHPTRWTPRYAILLASCMVFACASVYASTQMHVDLEHATTIEVASGHSPIDHEHGDVVAKNMDDHDHDHAADHEIVAGHDDAHGSRLHVLVSHHSPIELVFFAIFILNGMFWMLRYGPRHLMGSMFGKHHHHHDASSAHSA